MLLDANSNQGKKTLGDIETKNPRLERIDYQGMQKTLIVKD